MIKQTHACVREQWSQCKSEASIVNWTNDNFQEKRRSVNKRKLKSNAETSKDDCLSKIHEHACLNIDKFCGAKATGLSA